MFGAFVTAFCVGSIILGALYILVPEGSLSKPVSYAFGIAFLCLILSVGKLTSINLPQIDYKSAEFANERLSAASAEMIFSEALAREDINFSKITVFTDKTESGGISITKVVVYTDASPVQVNAVIGSDGYEVLVINE